MAANVAVVYGGAGALGRSIVATFVKNNWKVFSIDFIPNDEANVNITLALADSWQQASDKVLGGVSDKLGSDKVGAIVNVAGGWAGGSITSPDVIKNTELMIAQSVHSSIISGQLAAKTLTENGLLLLTGANAATGGTPGMIAYGIAKGAVHQLIKSLAAEGSGLPSKSFVVGLLPITLDTPANRKFAAADTDFGTWTPVDAIASKVFHWATHQERSKSGDLVQVATKEGQTSFTVVG